MTCAEFEQVLPDLLEGSSDLELEAHLKTCPRCSELVSDLRAITEECKLLRASEEPPARLWSSIQATLRDEGLIRQTPARRPFVIPVSTSRWGVTAWLAPVAAALVIGLAFFLAHPTSQQVAERQGSALRVGISATSGVSGQPSNDDDQQVMAEISKSAPLMQTAYQEDLRNVNSYIQDAEDFLRQHPNDDEAEQYLMEARQQKEMLYEMALNRSLP